MSLGGNQKLQSHLVEWFLSTHWKKMDSISPKPSRGENELNQKIETTTPNIHWKKLSFLVPKVFFSPFSAFCDARESRDRLAWRCSARADTATSPQPRSGSPWPLWRGRLGAEAAQGGARKGFNVDGTSSMGSRLRKGHTAV